MVAEMSTCLRTTEVGFNNDTSILAMLFDIYDIGGHLNVSLSIGILFYLCVYLSY